MMARRISPFAGLIGTHAAVGEDEARHARWRKVMDEMLHPGKVGVAFGRHAELPAHIVVFAEPIGIVERRIGEDVIGAKIRMQIAAEGVGVFGAEVGFDAAQGEIHHGETAGGGIAFLSVNGNVAELAAVGFDEFLRLHEHAAGTAGGVVNASFVGREHFDEQPHDATGRVELPAVLAFGAGETGEEIFVNASEQIDGAMRLLAFARGGERDRADEVNQFAEAMFVEARPRVIFWQHTFETRIIAFDGDHRVIDDFANGGLLGAVLQITPARSGRNPKNIFSFVFVLIFGIRAFVIAFARDEFGAVFLERVGNVFEKNQAEDDVLVFRRVHVVAEFVGGEPELGFESDVGSVVRFSCGAGHWLCEGL
jgi:hypothetical protein